MAYTTINFKTKKALKEAVSSGVKVTVYNPGIGRNVPVAGSATIEGPHYPEPHRWYASVTIHDGFVVTVK